MSLTTDESESDASSENAHLFVLSNFAFIIVINALILILVCTTKFSLLQSTVLGLALFSAVLIRLLSSTLNRQATTATVLLTVVLHAICVSITSAHSPALDTCWPIVLTFMLTGFPLAQLMGTTAFIVIASLIIFHFSSKPERGPEEHGGYVMVPLLLVYFILGFALYNTFFTVGRTVWRLRRHPEEALEAMPRLHDLEISIFSKLPFALLIGEGMVLSQEQHVVILLHIIRHSPWKDFLLRISRLQDAEVLNVLSSDGHSQRPTFIVPQSVRFVHSAGQQSTLEFLPEYRDVATYPSQMSKDTTPTARTSDGLQHGMSRESSARFHPEQSLTGQASGETVTACNATKKPTSSGTVFPNTTDGLQDDLRIDESNRTEIAKQCVLMHLKIAETKQSEIENFRSVLRRGLCTLFIDFHPNRTLCDMLAKEFPRVSGLSSLETALSSLADILGLGRPVRVARSPRRSYASEGSYASENNNYVSKKSYASERRFASERDPSVKSPGEFLPDDGRPLDGKFPTKREHSATFVDYASHGETSPTLSERASFASSESAESPKQAKYNPAWCLQARIVFAGLSVRLWGSDDSNQYDFLPRGLNGLLLPEMFPGDTLPPFRPTACPSYRYIQGWNQVKLIRRIVRFWNRNYRRRSGLPSLADSTRSPRPKPHRWILATTRHGPFMCRATEDTLPGWKIVLQPPPLSFNSMSMRNFSRLHLSHNSEANPPTLNRPTFRLHTGVQTFSGSDDVRHAIEPRRPRRRSLSDDLIAPSDYEHSSRKKGFFNAVRKVIPKPPGLVAAFFGIGAERLRFITKDCVGFPSQSKWANKHRRALMNALKRIGPRSTDPFDRMCADGILQDLINNGDISNKSHRPVLPSTKDVSFRTTKPMKSTRSSNVPAGMSKSRQSEAYSGHDSDPGPDNEAKIGFTSTSDGTKSPMWRNWRNMWVVATSFRLISPNQETGVYGAPPTTFFGTFTDSKIERWFLAWSCYVTSYCLLKLRRTALILSAIMVLLQLSIFTAGLEFLLREKPPLRQPASFQYWFLWLFSTFLSALVRIIIAVSVYRLNNPYLFGPHKVNHIFKLRNTVYAILEIVLAVTEYFWTPVLAPSEPLLAKEISRSLLLHTFCFANVFIAVFSLPLFCLPSLASHDVISLVLFTMLLAVFPAISYATDVIPIPISFENALAAHFAGSISLGGQYLRVVYAFGTILVLQFVIGRAIQFTLRHLFLRSVFPYLLYLDALRPLNESFLQLKNR